MPDRGLELNVELGDATLRPFLGEIRIVSPALADKVENAALHDTPVDLDEREIQFVASAAQTLRQSSLVDDSELDEIARL
jgi:hypothetical protein